MSTKIAVIQKPPVLLDRDKTIAQAVGSINEAAGAGATLLVFPEAYIPGYPTWIWRLKPGGDMALSSELHARLRRNAVDLKREDLRPLQEAASRHAVTVVMGMNEIDSRFSGTTLFNTRGHHRPRWDASEPSSQVDADKSGAHGVGNG